MTFFTFTERVLIPSVIAIMLVGGIASLVLGCALVLNHGATLRFITRMNRWVSTREAFALLDAPINVEPAAGAGGRRPLLGTFLLLAGALAVYFLFVRLNFRHAAPFAPGIGVQRWLISGVALETMKWVLVTGCAFAAIIGAVMLAAPQRFLAIERRLNEWHSSEPLTAVTERMRTPLEPRVEAHPRATGFIIAIASLALTLAMVTLLLTRGH
ncbi:MAG: hypothetical protein ABR570_09410 [Burkholderiales bacterium]